MDEIVLTLNEGHFTNVCKNGSIEFGVGYNKSIINISKSDMKKIALGEEVSIDAIGGQLFKISIVGIQFEMVKEILRRSPMYSDMYYEI